MVVAYRHLEHGETLVIAFGTDIEDVEEGNRPLLRKVA
jgi:hypothetical protein